MEKWFMWLIDLSNGLDMVEKLYKSIENYLNINKILKSLTPSYLKAKILPRRTFFFHCDISQNHLENHPKPTLH